LQSVQRFTVVLLSKFFQWHVIHVQDEPFAFEVFIEEIHADIEKIFKATSMTNLIKTRSVKTFLQ